MQCFFCISKQNWYSNREEIEKTAKILLDILKENNSPQLVILVTHPDEATGSKLDYVNFLLDYQKNHPSETEMESVCLVAKKLYIDECIKETKEILFDENDPTKNLLKVFSSYENKEFGIVMSKSIAINFNMNIITEIFCRSYIPYLNLDLKNCLKETGTQVVVAFTSICGALSLLPVLEIPVNIIITNYMLEMLACLSLDPNKNSDTFKKGINAIPIIVTNVLRFALLGITTILDLTIIGSIISIPMGIAISSIGTGIIGGIAVNYFLSDDF